MWEYYNEKEIHLYINFQLSNSFGNPKLQREVHLYIRFHLGTSFGNFKMQRKVHLHICFQLRNSFICDNETKREVHLHIPFIQAVSSFGNIKMQR